MQARRRPTDGCASWLRVRHRWRRPHSPHHLETNMPTLSEMIRDPRTPEPQLEHRRAAHRDPALRRANASTRRSHRCGHGCHPAAQPRFAAVPEDRLLPDAAHSSPRLREAARRTPAIALLTLDPNRRAHRSPHRGATRRARCVDAAGSAGVAPGHGATRSAVRVARVDRRPRLRDRLRRVGLTSATAANLEGAGQRPTLVRRLGRWHRVRSHAAGCVCGRQRHVRRPGRTSAMTTPTSAPTGTIFLAPDLGSADLA